MKYPLKCVKISTPAKIEFLCINSRDALVVDEPPIPIKHGDIIQIVHGLTGRALNRYLTFYELKCIFTIYCTKKPILLSSFCYKKVERV